jgi:hypothetical protein
MRIINSASLTRGATLIDYAFSESGKNLTLAPSDLVGLVAAYIARGCYTNDIETELGARLHPDIGRRAKQVFDLFDDWQGKALWNQGPANEDIQFTNRTLIGRYPGVNEAHRLTFHKH